MRWSAVLMTFAATAGVGTPALGAEGPLRLSRALGSPEWLELRLYHDLRYEHLFDQYRAGLSGDDQLLVLRTGIGANVALGAFVAGLELMDARIYLADDDTPLNTGFSNALDILEAHAGLELDDVFASGDRAVVRLGRYTMDIGSRRFVARNVYRNTINAFTGLDVRYVRKDGLDLHGFATLPVSRKPTLRDALADNDVVFDTETFDRIFWGLYGTVSGLSSGTNASVFVFGLHEDGDLDDRNLLTPGFRLWAARKPGLPDFEIEAALQVGRVQALDHFAYYLHGAAGYTFDVPASPNLAFMYDQASGDADPDDDSSGRFDTLFGVPRPELGPTMLYLAFHRRNIKSPGVRLTLGPLANVDGFVSYRAFALDEARDAWVEANLRDPTGRSGKFLGHQIEIRARWRIFPGNVFLDFGFAHLWREGFAEVAPGAGAAADPTLFYSQLGLEI